MSLSNNFSSHKAFAIDTSKLKEGLNLFYMENCGACKKQLNALTKIEDLYEISANDIINKINVADVPNSGINAVPTLVEFHNGEITASQVGLITECPISIWLLEQSYISEEQFYNGINELGCPNASLIA